MDSGLVTVFGGGGFLGRYVAQHLFKTGARVRIAERDPRRAYFLKPLYRVGQAQFAAVDLRDRERVAQVVMGSSAVINLIGVLRGDFHGIHVEGARNVALAARAAGAGSLVHVSAIGADPHSESEYGRSKGEGELAVRDAFPTATIIRPSIMFGSEDQFINRFAGMARMLPMLPVVKPTVKLQPVFVGDAGKAVTLAALHPKAHGGKIYELGGPQVLTMHELIAWICEATGRRRLLIDLPDPISQLIALLIGWAPGAPITWDQWMMLQKDNVVSDKARDLKAFGIAPKPLAAVADGWLTVYRRHGRFAAKTN